MKRGERILFIDGSAGASGDMLLGALVDLGLPVAHLRRVLQTLPVKGWTIRSRRVVKCALAARKIDVRIKGHEHGRGLKALKTILREGELPPAVRRRSLAVFQRLIEAEAEAHGKPVDKVHLHEAGGTDAIIDVVGTCIGLEFLKISHVIVSPLTTGFGTVRCAHGLYPVPAPATLLMMRGFPVRAGEIEAERLTPTGAALLTTVADDWGPFPAMRPLAVGYGAGDREFDASPNLLRAFIGEYDGPEISSAPQQAGEVTVIECTVDDSTPQALAYLAEQVLKLGALDVFITPVLMKKGRPGHNLTVLTREHQAPGIIHEILAESSSLGLRYRTERRVELERSHQQVRTTYGTVGIKIGRQGNKIVQVWPEYEDCATLARRKRVSLVEVQRAALKAFRSKGKSHKHS